ncbi:uncharacterized protein TRIADDRAFT_59461 [Trichoplax adhaerens]|uniref:Transcriptional adapter 3 n=1 Tax=Trichoplax adhaerens TaxID=10228 RepID=B3S5S7_TRIAD|nr:hypothetical protein TRIADDRAFT_59461 [Trichoplax adhaerens]EDV21846.1 hypothetical protein TRIADDRAFT_59461 [Trichoplax adhaerens]|eukprot:XP_002115483.1 hypothetical protein TRIADDRAFT_59461 [Trichoplax adhaerens]
MSKRNSEHPLQYYSFKHIDHMKSCPQYTSLLQHAVDDAPQITDEMLDSLNTELTLLEKSISERAQRLGTELEIVVDWLDRKDKKDSKGSASSDLQNSESSDHNKQSTPGLKRSTHDDQLNKKQKLKGNLSKKQKKKHKAKDVPVPVDNDKKLKTDAPTRFWAAVDSYCTDITQEDIKILDQLLECEDYSEYYTMPPLGMHYTKRWAKEDLLEERSQGKRAAEAEGNINEDHVDDLNKTNQEIDSLLRSNNNKNSYTDDSDDYCPVGALTQRLLASLVEENIVAPAPIQIYGSESTGGDGNSNHDNTKSRLNSNERDLSQVSQWKTLDKRIREELITLNIISRSDIVADSDGRNNDDEDEVLSELHRRQQELKAVNQENVAFIQQLKEASIRETKRQKLLQSVRVCDNEVIDYYKRFAPTKSKKKGLTKEETERAWQLLKSRQAAINKLNQFDSSL